MAATFFNNNAKTENNIKKNFKSCCAINVLLAKNSKFQKSPKTPYDAYIAIAQIIVEFERKSGKRLIGLPRLYPFSWIFWGCLFVSLPYLIENSAIFTKMQWILWKIFDCNFWKKNDRKKNITKQQKCYTTSWRISICAYFAILFFRLDSVSVFFKTILLFIWNWGKNDPF